MNELKSWIRPDGTRVEDYNLDGLNNEDIAFLIVRRAPTYIQACDDVERGILTPKRVADSFGMYRYKHYKEDREEGAGRPRFTAATVSVFHNRNGKKYRRITVSPGRVAIVVSLEEMSKTDRNETYLIEKVIAEKLRTEVERFRTESDSIQSRPEKPNGVYRLNLEACLQVFDLDANNVPDSEIYSLVPYLSKVEPKETDHKVGAKKTGDAMDPARKRLRDIRKRNVKLFQKLEIAHLLIHKS